MLWVKAFHIVFVMSWMAGLFYLPRLFVNHAMVDEAATKERFTMMERKLYRFMTALGHLALIFGVWLWLGWGVGGHWLHAKLTLVVVLVAYHFYCRKIIRQLAEGTSKRSHIWFRWFNEIPTLAMIGIVILVVVKPF